ncbi:Rpn family recombination-promoting nuclease/putative transposase [Clostridium oryzae]|uniref:PD-(D/E)XK nuclease family transposase n=1 Tax=Clostridium oryzae TaxID=1450648 RepID=A0A1V4IZ68_9CLOT|nr:Rpn family recombination-promoting nuclease/putative transposase [Clostridium oryzae]OPJ65075.1 PD-(D/E)XK nuclease family transposase [Clostridium oryzae]
MYSENEDFIMSPKNDFAFKLLFGEPKNIDLLKALLCAILKVDKDEFWDLKIINNELQRQFLEDKKGILDVHAKTKDGKEIDIEIQILPTEYMAERTLFYWSKLYNSQIKSGDSYDKLKKCITINILDFKCTPLNMIHTTYHITEDNTSYRLSQVLEIHYLELPKLEEENIEKNENETIVQWMEFISTKNKEVMEMLAERNNDIRKAYSELQVMSKDEIARMAYEAREAEIHDQKTRMETARKEGFEKGSMRRAIENAENLLKLGVNEEIVAKGTGLTIEQILEIKKKLL